MKYRGGVRFVALLMLLSSLAFAEAGEVKQQHATARLVTSTALAGAASFGASVAGFATGMAMTRACFDDVSGRPSPVCNAGVFALGGAVQLGLTLLVVPELFRLTDADIGEVRLTMWRYMRWPALALAAAAVTFLIGAAVEQREFGAGQGAMAVGIGGALVGGLTVDVVAVIGAFNGARATK